MRLARRLADDRLLPALIALALQAALASSAGAAAYYVDATAGSDSNNGLTPSSAWRNAPGMAAYSGSGRLAPGDTVYFDSADSWLVSGTQGIFLTGGVTYVGNEWGSGTRATLRASADIASAVVRFRDHALMETTFRGFEVDANGKVTNGIEMNHSFYEGPLTGASKRVDDVVVHDVWSRTSQGQYKYGIIVSNHGGRNGEVANVEILNSVVHDISRDGLPIYPGDESADCMVRNVLVRGNTVYNTGLDPDYGAGSGIIVKGHVVDAVIEYNYVTGTKGAGLFVNGNESNHFGVGPTNVHFRHNVVAVDTIHGSIRIYDGSSGKDPKDIKVYGNLVLNNSQGGGFLIDRDLGHTNSILVFNNTFFNAPVVVNNAAASFPVLEFRNNIFFHESGLPFSDSGRVTAHSNNLFFGSGTLVRSAGTSFVASNLASYESTAVAADPLFTDAASLPGGWLRQAGGNLSPDRAGLSLRAGSPAVDAGAALGTPYSSSIESAVSRPVGGGWDIGAYERLGGAPPMPPANLTVD
jgi:hypothetical protein